MTPGDEVVVKAEVKSADLDEVRVILWDKWRKPHLVIMARGDVYDFEETA